MTQIEKVDVLIVGGGPVGLFFAYQMASWNHTFYLCDNKEGPTTESRALGLSSRTMEMLEAHKIAPYIIKEAFVNYGVQLYIGGKKLGILGATGDTKFPQLTCSPQGKTESILSRLLGEDQIHRATELVHYEQTSDGVDAIVRNMKTNDETRIHARYIIGADGSHSAVRKLAENWKYEGFAVATKFAVCDALVAGRDADKVSVTCGNVFYHPQGVCGMIPAFEKDKRFYHRIFVNIGQYQVEENSRKKEASHGLCVDDSISLEEFQVLVNKHVSPLELEIKDPEHLSIFRINERLADGFRRDRAFVVGDAAHCHSPFGGQGLNLGLQDAANLAWKLSLVMSGLSSNPEKLLDSYSIERTPIAAATLKGTGMATRLGTASSTIISMLVRLIVPIFLSLETLRNRLAESIMQIGTEVPKESTILSPTSSKNQYLVQPGKFIRDTTPLRRRMIIKDGHFDRQSLHEIMQENQVQHTIIWVSSRPARLGRSSFTPDFYTKFKSHGYSTAAARALIVESIWHTHQSKPPAYVKHTEEAMDHWMEEQWDVQNSISKRIGLADYMNETPEPPAAIVIVRPDLYVAYSGLVKSRSDIDQAFEFLDGYLAKNS